MAKRLAVPPCMSDLGPDQKKMVDMTEAELVLYHGQARDAGVLLEKKQLFSKDPSEPGASFVALTPRPLPAQSTSTTGSKALMFLKARFFGTRPGALFSAYQRGWIPSSLQVSADGFNCFVFFVVVFVCSIYLCMLWCENLCSIWILSFSQSLRRV